MHEHCFSRDKSIFIFQSMISKDSNYFRNIDDILLLYLRNNDLTKTVDGLKIVKLRQILLMN